VGRWQAPGKITGKERDYEWGKLSKWVKEANPSLDLLEAIWVEGPFPALAKDRVPRSHLLPYEPRQRKGLFFKPAKETAERLHMDTWKSLNSECRWWGQTGPKRTK
jgi:hypothetical protein